MNAALRMIEALSNVSKILPIEKGVNLKMGRGVASSPVTLGIIGSKYRRTFPAIDHHINLAPCLKIQARSSKILVEENTFDKLKNFQNFFQ
jgi:class 3 adenylate cyclase